jgi:beta-lactamase class A/LysM repeat protein
LLAVLIVASLLGSRSLVANVADGAQHVVKPGETLSGIAAQYGVTVDQLLTLNGIADPNRLTEGQTLKLPSTVRTAPPTAPATAPAATQPPATAATGTQASSQTGARTTAPSEYVVQPGDTLSGIAKSLGISQKALLDANEITEPDKLTVGLKLTVPAGALAPGASGTTNARAGQPGAGAPGAGTPAPAALDDAGPILDKLAGQYGVDPALVRALAWIETDGKPQKLNAPGGIGYLTVTDKTFEYIQQTLVKRTLDRANQADNFEAGIAYVASMLKWGGDETKGLAGFLQGPGSVRTNGVRPNIEQEIKRIQALRDKIKLSGPFPTTAGTGAGQAAASPTTAPTASNALASTQPQPQAQPKLAPTDNVATLTARAIGVARSIAGPTAKVGIAGRNLVTGQRVSVAADQSFPAASVGKLALLVEVYRQSANGTLALTDERRADVKAMIVNSDNDAANRILELLGKKAVNANLQALGMIGTRLGNPFGLASTTGAIQNVTTPADMARLMEMMASEQLVSAQASREMRGLLLQAQDGSKLRRGLPTDARIAHKSGWYDGVANDIGIVTHGQSSYVLGVFTEGIPDAETANHTIAAVAESIHGSWGPVP